MTLSDLREAIRD